MLTPFLASILIVTGAAILGILLSLLLVDTLK